MQTDEAPAKSFRKIGVTDTVVKGGKNVLSNEDFVKLSLETNLFFMRIAREHSVFLQNGFTLRDFNLAKHAENFKKEFTKLLSEALELATKILDNNRISFEELAMNSTLQAEKHLEFCTGIDIDTSVTQRTLAFRSQNRSLSDNVLDSVDKIVILNERAIIVVTSFIEFKERLLHDLLQARIFLHMHPLFVDHLLREIRIYLEMLFRLQERIELDPISGIPDEQIVWSNIMTEHAKFIQVYLDPSEVELREKTDFFAKEFDRLTREGTILGHNKIVCKQLGAECNETTNAFQHFTQRIAHGILDCRVRVSVLPLLIDHFTREARYFARIMGDFKCKTL